MPSANSPLPEAVLKFRQGVGRLIRTKTDTGIFVIHDPRVLTKQYGRAFLDALPRCPVGVVSYPLPCCKFKVASSRLRGDQIQESRLGLQHVWNGIATDGIGHEIEADGELETPVAVPVMKLLSWDTI